jgi:hypothetical protein
MLWLASHAALAAPGPSPAPPLTEWSAQASALGGATWPGADAAPLGSFRASAWSSHTTAPWRIGAGLAGIVDDASGGWLDGELAQLQVDAGQRLRGGGALELRGAALSTPWTEATLAPTLDGTRGTARWTVRAGPAWRGDQASGSGGVHVSAFASVAPSVRLYGWMQLQARVWAHGLPPSLDVDGRLQVAPAERVALVTDAGTTLTGPGSTVIGGYSPRSAFVHARFATEISVVGPWVARAELGVDWTATTAGPPTVSAALGAVARFGHTGARSRAMFQAGSVMLAVRAPDAVSVAVVGSFSAWVPVPMSQDRHGGWSVALDLAPGEYEYCYLIDGVTTVPPESDVRRPDGFGGENGVMMVTP